MGEISSKLKIIPFSKRVSNTFSRKISHGSMWK